ncbi:hypothetical protein FHL15_010756 [Xylaria flabelliformis]|uniref:C2H2-type domain-containing protein n=1 Tax=Xylaria flabelliformis TaxID=2512241 RepID=A0A553HKA8_9PEZI|nr:hypothetical protein FHL15_010756 [Xylaria flabelliformis]
MVKRLASGKNEVSAHVSSRTEGASAVVAQDSAHGGGPRQRVDVCEDSLTQAYVGRDWEQSSDCGLARNNDSMEQTRVAVAAKRSRSDREDRGEDRTLTAEEYIAHRKEIAVERVMSGFQRWLDKRLAIISYTIEASEASDDPGTGAHTTGSQSQDTGGKKSGGASGRPKRQLSDNNDPDDLSGGGDDNGQDRGGNKRAKTETDPEELKFACPFHKHNPKTHKKELCMKGGWKSIHRLKEHLYRVHLLPKHNCPRCNLCFENDKELQVHLRADEPCKKSNVAPEEGIDQDTERKLRERKRHNSGQTETQRWNDIYLLLFPGADRNAIPSPYPDYDETATRYKNLERYKRVESRIKRELPRLVKQRVERKFEKVEADMLHDINDIIRNCLADFFRNNMSQDEASLSNTPQTTSRATTPVLTSVEEPHPLSSFDTTFEPQIGVDYLLDDPDLGISGGLGLFDFNPLCIDSGGDGYGVDKVSSDSGYVSTSTFTVFQ